MSRKFDMADYYYHSKDISERYKISMEQAGCHIVKYPTEMLCAGCKWANSCAGIYEWEKNVEGNVYGE